MTALDLATKIAALLGWSAHDESFAVQIAENLLRDFTVRPKRKPKT